MRRFSAMYSNNDIEALFPNYGSNKLDALIVEMFKIFANVWVEEDRGAQIPDFAAHVLTQIDSAYNTFNLWQAGGFAQAEHIYGFHPLLRVSFEQRSANGREMMAELQENIRAPVLILETKETKPTDLFSKNQEKPETLNTEDNSNPRNVPIFNPRDYQSMNDVPLSGIPGIEELKRQDIEVEPEAEIQPERSRRFDNLRSVERSNVIAPTTLVNPRSRYPELNPIMYGRQEIPRNPLTGVGFIPATENYSLLKEMFKFNTVRDDADFKNLKQAIDATYEKMI
jgi:hypothetical protein